MRKENWRLERNGSTFLLENIAAHRSLRLRPEPTIARRGFLLRRKKLPVCSCASSIGRKSGSLDDESLVTDDIHDAADASPVSAGGKDTKEDDGKILSEDVDKKNSTIRRENLPHISTNLDESPTDMNHDAIVTSSERFEMTEKEKEGAMEEQEEEEEREEEKETKKISPSQERADKNKLATTEDDETVATNADDANIDEETTLEIKLGHFSMGPTRCRLVMESLSGDYGRIERLDCRGNRLRGRDLVILLRNASMHMTRRLRHLDLSDNKFDMASIDALGCVLESCQHLDSLLLSKCGISDVMGVRLEQYLFRRDSGCYLESVDLSSNNFRDASLEQLAHSIEISFRSDDNYDDDGKNADGNEREIPNNYHRVTFLRHLNLSHTTFARDAADQFMRSIAKCSLHSLDLEATALGRGGITNALAFSLEKNMSLRALNVAFNNISPSQTLVLADAFAKHPNLASLNMYVLFLALVPTTSLVSIRAPPFFTCVAKVSCRRFSPFHTRTFSSAPNVTLLNFSGREILSDSSEFVPCFAR